LPNARRHSIAREVLLIRRSLASVIRSLVRLAPALQAAAAAGRGRPAVPRRRLRLSPARRAALKLQGQYMGHLRTLPPGQKARVKAVRVQKGIRPAIALARKLGAS
jgi:hypothetical protein